MLELQHLENNEYHCTGCNHLVSNNHKCDNPKAKKMEFNKHKNKTAFEEIIQRLNQIEHQNEKIISMLRGDM